MTSTLQQEDWEKTSTVVARFQYAQGQQMITASPTEMAGAGWTAVIDGQHEVRFTLYLPLGRREYTY